MIKIQTSGLYCYHVTGDLEKAAAEELTRVYDFLMRSHLSGDAFHVEFSDAKKRIEKEYDVEIKASIF